MFHDFLYPDSTLSKRLNFLFSDVILRGSQDTGAKKETVHAYEVIVENACLDIILMLAYFWDLRFFCELYRYTIRCRRNLSKKSIS